MAMTADVKDELSRIEHRNTCCRKAETSSLLRLFSRHPKVQAEQLHSLRIVVAGAEKLDRRKADR